MQNYNRAWGLTGSSLSILRGRGKVVYILPFSDPTLALILVRFSEYYDDVFQPRIMHTFVCIPLQH
ncbi:hypothetical protein Hanom_Chr00s000002g01598841 [Helianthus anomalus]